MSRLYQILPNPCISKHIKESLHKHSDRVFAALDVAEMQRFFADNVAVKHALALSKVSQCHE